VWGRPFGDAKRLRWNDITFDAIEPWVEARAARSGGPGGQHVNKVSTRITLLFDFEDCDLLGPRQKRLIAQGLAGRVGRDGRLRVGSQKHRSQAANRRAAGERMAELLREVLKPRRKRIATRPTAASRRRRLEQKRRRGEIKRQRGWRGSDE